MEIEIIGYIGEDFWTGEGVTEKSVRNQLREAAGQDVDFLINSHGGDVKEGLGIQSAIQGYQGKTRAIITGFASSAATWCAINCDEVTMTEHGFMMIHNTIGMTWGNQQEHRKAISELQMIDEQFVSMYAEKTSLSRERIKNMMDAETMFNADEALQNGFIDDIVEIGERENTTLENAINCARKSFFPDRILDQMQNRSPQLVGKSKTNDGTKTDAKKDREIEVLKRRNKRLKARA